MKKYFFFLWSIFFYLLSPTLSWASEVHLLKDGKSAWSLSVDQKPYFIRGVDYRVSKVGESPDFGTHRDWAFYDENRNGRNDGAYDSWVDTNGNNQRDTDEPVVGDFELLRRMGVNTIRWYMNDFHGQRPNKDLFRDLFSRYGIRIAVGNKFGAYTIDSGASWNEGTDYRNPDQQAKMLESVRRMVLEHKDEPYTLLWILGNENNLRFTNTNAAQFSEVYARFLNQAARLIHDLDGRHPVALVNGDAKLIEYYHRFCPDIDIFGTNCYRGPNGFGSLWAEVQKTLNKPILITEYGGSYAPGLDEDSQASYHTGCWRDIWKNRAGGEGKGNAIGGFAFEWLDEWWKAGDPDRQAEPGSSGQIGIDKARWTQEYCGIASQGDGSQSHFLRHLRRVYSEYQRLWAADHEKDGQ